LITGISSFFSRYCTPLSSSFDALKFEIAELEETQAFSMRDFRMSLLIIWNMIEKKIIIKPVEGSKRTPEGSSGSPPKVKKAEKNSPNPTTNNTPETTLQIIETLESSENSWRNIELIEVIISVCSAGDT
tara:strand:+ start:1208 stop:1597 length:390 start_codon:yes stop_codon:yes gene_type:complete